jgi:hypothetical protein
MNVTPTDDRTVMAYVCEGIAAEIRKANLVVISSLRFQAGSPSETARFVGIRLIGALYGMNPEGRCRVRVNVVSTDDELSTFEVKVQGYDTEAKEFVFGSKAETFSVSPIHFAAFERCLELIRHETAKPLLMDK